MKIYSIHGPKESLFSKPNPSFVRFIPSIVKWKETQQTVLYLVSYRVWKPETDPKRPVVRMDDPGHPWVTFWKMSKFDGTGFFILEVSKQKPLSMQIVREFPLTRNSRVDMRMVPIKDKPGEFWVTFNSFGLLNPNTYRKNHTASKDSAHLFRPTCFLYKQPNTGKVLYDTTRKTSLQIIDANRTLTNVQKQAYKQQSWCTFQNKTRLVFHDNKFAFKETGLVCPKHHQRFEKNLQIFVSESGGVGYQYAITPWTFFKPGDCETMLMPYSNKQTTGSLFSKLVRYFDPRKDIVDMNRNVAFSCSTPLMDYSETEYLAVGHFKIHHHTKFPESKRRLRSFLQKTQRMFGMDELRYEGYEDRIHPKLIYGMFFYTVNKKSLRMSKASGGFIPLYNGYKQALSFPTGISEHTKDNFLVSYHENDMTMRLLHMTRSEIDNTLVFDDKTKPPEYTFVYKHLI